MNRRRHRAFAAALVTACLVAPAPQIARAAPGGTTMVTPAGANGPTPATSVPDVTSPQISLDGHMVAFSSDASNLVRGDTNGVADVFVKDLNTGRITRVSTTARGGQANGASYSPSLSVFGDILAFVSTATNLVSGDTNGVADVFLKNLKTGRISRISLGPKGRQANGASNDPSLSVFGNYVTFESSASNLASGDGNGLDDAFVRDVAHERTEIVRAPTYHEDVEIPGTAIVSTTHASISYDGRLVAFEADVRRTTRTDPIAQDVYVLDRRKKRLTHLILPAWGSRTREMCAEPVISADGRYVAFTAWSDLTEGDSVAGQNDYTRQTRPLYSNDDALQRNPFDFKNIWVYDGVSKHSLEISSTGVGGAPLPDGDSAHPAISANGHAIAFSSDATNLVAGDTNGATDAFVRDLDSRTMSRASVGGFATQTQAAAGAPSMSYEGRRVVFATTAALTSADKNGVSDVYLRDRETGTRDTAPVLPAPFRGVRAVNLAQQVSVRVRAHDADHDPLRYGVILNLPSGASIDPVTGVFTWTVSPSEKTGHRYVVFWAQDPRGLNAFMLLDFYVRNSRQTATCDAGVQCDG